MNGKTVQARIYDFVQALDRHIQEARQVWRETGYRTAPIASILGRRAFDGSSVDYLDAISDLYSTVTSTFGSGFLMVNRLSFY